MRVDDPHLNRVFEELRAAGIEPTDQHDARLRWLEMRVEQLGAYVEQLEGRLLTNWPGPEPKDQEDQYELMG
jgi:hypothetical protein